MRFSLNIQNTTGHVKVQVEGNKATLNWADSQPLQELAGLQKWIRDYMDKGYTAHVEGKKISELKDEIFKSKGSLVLEGKEPFSEFIVKDMLKATVSKAQLLMQLQPDNTWRITKIEDVEVEQGKDNQVMTQMKGGGG